MEQRELTHTEFIVAYIEEEAKPELLQEVRRRLHAFRTDQLLDSGYIEEYIEDKSLSFSRKFKIRNDRTPYPRVYWQAE